MRIIAGYLGGRNFSSADSKRTHPMSDKTRGALFNVLGDIEGLIVLDAFAGSGAITYEAISRGASMSVAIDIDRIATKTITTNIKKLGIHTKVKVINASVGSWLNKSRSKLLFDLILCDPPFDDLQIDVVRRLIRVLTPTGLFVLSWPSNTDSPILEGLSQIKTNQYGDNQLLFYRFN